MSLLNQPRETPSMGHKGLHEFSSMLPLLCLQGQGSVHLVRILEFLNTILMKKFLMRSIFKFKLLVTSGVFFWILLIELFFQDYTSVKKLQNSDQMDGPQVFNETLRCVWVNIINWPKYGLQFVVSYPLNTLLRGHLQTMWIIFWVFLTPSQPLPHVDSFII